MSSSFLSHICAGFRSPVWGYGRASNDICACFCISDWSGAGRRAGESAGDQLCCEQQRRLAPDHQRHRFWNGCAQGQAGNHRADNHQIQQLGYLGRSAGENAAGCIPAQRREYDHPKNGRVCCGDWPDWAGRTGRPSGCFRAERCDWTAGPRRCGWAQRRNWRYRTHWSAGIGRSYRSGGACRRQG